MAEKPKSSINTQVERIQSVLVALSSIVGQPSATFQIYTSKRGRCWVSIRQSAEYSFTTACEVDDPCDAMALAIAVGHACFIHVRKRSGALPAADTWTPVKEAMAGNEMLATWLDAGELPAISEHGQSPEDPADD